jgi:hypothetical protein
MAVKEMWEETILAYFKIIFQNFASRDYRRPVRESGPRPPEYEAPMLATKPRLSVCFQ